MYCIVLSHPCFSLEATVIFSPATHVLQIAMVCCCYFRDPPQWSGWRAWEISAMHDCRAPVSIPATSNSWHLSTWTPLSSTVMDNIGREILTVSSRIHQVLAGISDLDVHQKIVEERNLGEFETSEVLGNRDIDVMLNARMHCMHWVHVAIQQRTRVRQCIVSWATICRRCWHSQHILGVCCPQRCLEFLEKKGNPCARRHKPKETGVWKRLEFGRQGDWYRSIRLLCCLIFV